MPALLLTYTLTVVLATAMAVDWRLSLWGPRDNPLGAAVALSSVAFCLLLAGTLRTEVHVSRLVTALLLGSVPVAIYGLVQYLGLDPLPWVTDAVSPVHSTLGRSNFLGAYLAMVIPFTLLRLAETGSARRGVAKYALVLGLQVACLVLTWARAAWLGFIAGCVVFLALLACRSHKRALWFALTAVLVLGSVWLVFINNHDVPISPWAASHEADPTEGTGLSFVGLRQLSVELRIATWRSALELFVRRPLLGYGPGCFADDPHNLFLYQMISSGLLGLLAFLGVMIGFYWTASRAFVRTTDEREALALATALASVTAFLVQAQFNPLVITLSALLWVGIAIGMHGQMVN